MRKIVITICMLVYSQLMLGQNRISTLAGVWAPAGVKINGDATEWGYKYIAYDEASQLHYTLSNDDKNLYFVVHTASKNTIDKIYIGGITLSVISPINDKDKSLSVLYPNFNKGINNGAYLIAYSQYQDLKKDSLHKAEDMVKLAKLMSKSFADTYKMMWIKGIKTITDPTVSIYNEEGITASAAFDNHFSFTYEMRIPLKYVLQSTGSSGIKLNIRLNGIERPNGRSLPVVKMIGPDGKEVIDMNKLYTEHPSDFFVRYVLAKP